MICRVDEALPERAAFGVTAGVSELLSLIPRRNFVRGLLFDIEFGRWRRKRLLRLLNEEDAGFDSCPERKLR